MLSGRRDVQARSKKAKPNFLLQTFSEDEQLQEFKPYFQVGTGKIQRALAYQSWTASRSTWLLVYKQQVQFTNYSAHARFHLNHYASRF